jgi:hypothetical protein
MPKFFFNNDTPFIPGVEGRKNFLPCVEKKTYGKLGKQVLCRAFLKNT